MHYHLKSCLLLSLCSLAHIHGFLPQSITNHRNRITSSSFRNLEYTNKFVIERNIIRLRSHNNEEEGENLLLTLDTIPSDFEPLFSQAALTTAIARKPVTTEQTHDPFRFEWGTWVDEESIKTLMERVDEVLLMDGAYDKLLAIDDSAKPPLRFKVASGKDWDCLLHVLPTDVQYEGRWSTG